MVIVKLENDCDSFSTILAHTHLAMCTMLAATINLNSNLSGGYYHPILQMEDCNFALAGKIQGPQWA